MARGAIVFGRRPGRLRASHLADGDTQPIACMANHLRDRHKCDHEDHWMRMEVSYRWEERHRHMSKYVFDCRRCDLRAYTRCRQNHQ